MKRAIAVIMTAAAMLMNTGCAVGADFRSEADERLYRCIEQGGEISEISLCIADGANIDRLRRGRLVSVNMVEFAARQGRADIAGWLVDNGADVDYKTSIMGETLLMSMSAANEYELCKLLLERGADIAARDRLSDTALEYAFKAGGSVTEEEIDRLITLLIDNGAQIRRETFTAAIGGYTGKGDGDCRYGLVSKIARLTREEGISTKMRPALEAAVMGDFDGAVHLIEEGGVSAGDRQQILFYAAAFGGAAVLDRLADIGQNLNTADKDGNTLLILAARYGNYETAGYLLDTLSAPETKNQHGKTALEAAYDAGNPELAALIESRLPAASAGALFGADCECGCNCSG